MEHLRFVAACIELFYIHKYIRLLLQVGGTPAVLKYLLQHGFIDGSCLTVTGECFFEPFRPQRVLSSNQALQSACGVPACYSCWCALLHTTAVLRALHRPSMGVAHVMPKGCETYVQGRHWERIWRACQTWPRGNRSSCPWKRPSSPADTCKCAPWFLPQSTTLYNILQFPVIFMAMSAVEFWKQKLCQR